jgi:hypothetical protein
MASFNKFNTFIGDMGKEVHDFSSDTVRLFLTNQLPVATNTQKSQITEIAAGNGYTTGGIAVPVTWTNSGTLWTLAGTANALWTASGGAFPTFRYVVAYNDSSANDSLISWYDYGSTVDVSDGETFQANSNGTLATIQ